MSENPPLPGPIQRRSQKRAPLTYGQQSLWFLQQLDPENNAYNSSHLIKFTGGIDRSNMEKALNDLVRRHEPLRTIYPNEGGRPVQVVQPFKPFSLIYKDFSDLVDEERQEVGRRYITDVGDKPYDLQRGPLVRFALLHLGKEEDELFLSIHHIGFDAWSWQVLLSEMMQLYDSYQCGKEPVLADLAIQYTDYALWQREWMSGKTLEVYTTHWENIISGDLPTLELPTDRPHPTVQSFRGARYRFQFPHPLESRLKSFCQKEHITPFHLYMAAYAVLLMHYSGQEDIILGCPFANRPNQDLNKMIGLFVNTLPIRVNLSANPVVREFLDQIREKMLDAFTWQAAPFDEVVAEISPERDLSRTPIFQVAINMRNVPKQYQVSIDGLEIEEILREDSPAPFDLSLEFDDVGNSLIVSLQYNTDLFDEKTIIHMAAHFQNLVSELMAKTDMPISEMEMLTGTERKRIVTDWNQTEVDFPKVRVQDLVTEQVNKDPEAMAVICNGKSLTYSELEKKANRLAHYLRKKGMGDESHIGIYLPRSENTVVAMLAILKAGCAYTPLDITFPAERTAYMVNDANLIGVITDSSLEAQITAQVQKFCIDSEAPLIDACEASTPVTKTTDDSPIYVMYTSGSTGRPKGVVNLHKGIVNYLTHMKKQFQMGPADRMVQLTSLSFDVSVFEIFSTLISGGMLFMMDDTQMRDPVYINKVIIDQQVTLLSMVPTMLRSICESALAHEPKKNSIRLIFPAGEALLKADVDQTRRAYGDAVQIVNQYGPTEASIIHTTYTVPIPLPGELQVVPIGKPISNARTYILDKNLHPVPVGARGELFLAGTGVARGYWNKPDLTAERFLADPFWQGGRMYRTGDLVRYLPDGTICYLGRSDDQIKIRGYRVEPGEIEAVIAEFPRVKAAAVKLWQQTGQETLTAYISVSDDDQKKIIEDLRVFLADRLPFYMMPSVIMILEELPLTPNGKVDHHALPAPENEDKHQGYVAPGNDIEKRLVKIWEKVLEVKNIGVKDNFFELGGHSLLAVRLITLIKEDFDQSIPLLLLFKHGTIEALATFLKEDEKAPSLNGVLPIKVEKPGPPLFILHAGLLMRNLANNLGETRPVYGLYPFENGQLAYRDSVQETAKIFYQCLINFNPDGPYYLLGHSANGLFALELARLLRQDNKKVAFLGLLDTYPPTLRWQSFQVNPVKFHLQNLKTYRFFGVLKYLFVYEPWKLTWKLKRRISHWWQIATRSDKSKRGGFVMKDMEGNQLLFRTYSPEVYDGQVTLFRVTSLPAYSKNDPMEKWPSIVTGPIEIVKVEGNHLTLLEPPQVDLLAEKILAILDKNETN